MRVGNLGYRHTVLLLALGAAGCAGASDAMNKENWFSKPAHLFETPSFMAPSRTSVQATRAITPDDLVDGSGGCAAAASASVAPGPDGAIPEASSGPTVVGGVALGMTECEVVQRAGRPERVEIGGDAGARTAVLTYPVGERAGIYRFAGGRLQSMDRVAEAARPVKPAKPPAKKKPANRPA